MATDLESVAIFTCYPTRHGYISSVKTPMNLREFIDFRPNCPICENRLVTYLHSNRKQTVNFEEDRITFVLNVTSLNNHQTIFKVGYSFKHQDNSYQIEYYTKDNQPLEPTSNHRKLFTDLHNNLNKSGFKFISECGNGGCMRYDYCSLPFAIDLQVNSIKSTVIGMETVGLVHTVSEVENVHRIYRLHNFLERKVSLLSFWKGTPEEACLYWAMPPNATVSELPLIPFVSPTETAKRLDNLVIFV